jgi:hypothetical protein
MTRRDEIRVSLFPFMSVLACTIGALTLLLATLSISAVTPNGAAPAPAGTPSAATSPDAELASEPAAPVGRAEPTVQEEKSQRARRRGARVEQEQGRWIARAEALWAEVDGSLAEQGRPPAGDLATLEAAFAKERQGRRLVDALGAIAAADDTLAAEREALEVEIAVLESRRATLPILIDPTGVSRHLEPWFATCDAGGLATHGRQGEHGSFVARDELSASTDFGRYLRRLRVLPGALLVLLIRPDGLATAARAESVAESLGVRVARLPLPGEGALDFSLLRRADPEETR